MLWSNSWIQAANTVDVIQALQLDAYFTFKEVCGSKVLPKQRGRFDFPRTKGLTLSLPSALVHRATVRRSFDFLDPRTGLVERVAFAPNLKHTKSIVVYRIWFKT